MELWRVLLLLTIWDPILSIPVSYDGNKRQPRQVDFKECCPCPETEVTSDQDVSPTQVLEPTPVASECPCKVLDSVADASMIVPALQTLQPIMRALETKPTPKLILEPEVGLASSVLETLREVTDKEYQDALVRDAERSAIKTLESIYSLTQNPEYLPSNVINVIITPEELNSNTDVYPEESRTQETRCGNLESNVDNIIQNVDRPSFDLGEACPSQNMVNNENVIDMDNAASSVIEHAYKSIEDTSLNESNPEIITVNTKIEELLPKNKELDKDLNNRLWNKKGSMLTLPNIIDSIKNINYKPLSENSLLKSSSDLDKISGNNIFSANKQNHIFNHLDPVSYLKSIKDIKPITYNGIARPVKLKDLLKLKDVELIQPKQNYNDNKMMLRNESSEKSRSIEVSDLQLNQDLMNKSKSLDALSSASEMQNVDAVPASHILVDDKYLTMVRNSENSLTNPNPVNSQIDPNNLKKDDQSFTSNKTESSNNLTQSSDFPIDSLMTDVPTSVINISNEDVIKEERNLTLSASNLSKNTGKTKDTKVDSTKNLGSSFLKNLDLKDANKELDSNILLKEEIMLAGSNKNEIQSLNIGNNNNNNPIKQHNSSLVNNSNIIEKTFSVDNTKSSIENYESNYEPRTIFTQNNKKSSNVDDHSFERKNVNIENRIFDETVTENISEMYSSTLIPIKSLDSMDDMNVEASESIFNYYPSMDLNKSQPKPTLSKELIVEPNLMDDNSYRSLVAMHLQQINNLLERNNEIVYNNNCQNSNNKHDLSSRLSQPLSTNIESKDINRIRNNFRKDSDIMASNLKEKTFIEPPFNEQQSLQSVLNRNEINLEDKIQNYFRNKVLDKNSLNKNLDNWQNFNRDGNKLEKPLFKDTVEGSSDKIQSFAKKPPKQIKLEKHRNLFPDSKNILKNPSVSTDLFKSIENKYSNQDFKDSFQFLNSKKPLKSTILSDKSKPLLLNKKKFELPTLSDTKSDSKNIITDPIKPFNRNNMILKTDNHRVGRPIYINEDEDLLKTIRDRIPKLNSEKNTDWSHLDRLQSIRDKIKTFETDTKAQIAENIKKINFLSPTTSRPDFLESVKKNFDTHFLDDKLKVKPFDKTISNKGPSLKKINNFKELKSSASETIPVQVKTSRDPNFKIHDVRPVLRSLENQEAVKYLDLDGYPHKDKLRNEHAILQAPYKDQRGELTKMLKASRIRPPNLNPLIETRKNQSDDSKDTIPLGSEHMNTMRVTEDALKENVSYKCKMVCFRDD